MQTIVAELMLTDGASFQIKNAEDSMKFANLDLTRHGHYTPGSKHYWNFGDQIQLTAIDELYRYAGVDLEDLVYLSSADGLSRYVGEKVVLPINICMLKTKGLDYSWLSPDIIPLFLGANIQTPYLTENMIGFFKNYQPIGCRDEFTYRTLKSYNIISYLSGCLSAVVFSTRIKNKNFCKTFFIDIPESLHPYIPAEVSENAINLSNDYYGYIEDIIHDVDIRYYVWSKYRELKDTARLVVTSRLHIAAPCASMGVPVILVKNNFPATFSWIERIVPTYSIEQFACIDWCPSEKKYEEIKEKTLKIASKRLLGQTVHESEFDEITNFYLDRNKNEFMKNTNIFQTMIDFMKQNWSKDTCLNYAVWGITDISEALYYYIQNNYPKVKLTKVYDKFNQYSFHGIESDKPETIKAGDDVFTFVCVMTAMVEAKDMFSRINKPTNSYLLASSIDDNNNMHISE